MAVWQCRLGTSNTYPPSTQEDVVDMLWMVDIALFLKLYHEAEKPNSCSACVPPYRKRRMQIAQGM